VGLNEESGSSWRLFIAHPVPGAVADELWRQLRPYRKRYPQARWTDRGSWHLTLLFLGSVLPDRVPELERLADREATAGDGPYRAHAERGDGRRRSSGGVAWLGLAEGAGRLIETASRLKEHCPADIAHGPPPKRTPAAHLTVVRRATAEIIEALRRQSHGTLGVSWTIEDIALMRSHLGPAGARYETLHLSTL
jgi:2'-5' RNA ligase